MPKDERARRSQFHWVGIIVGIAKVVEGKSRRYLTGVEAAKSDPVQKARKAIAARFLKGTGLEVGAGDRPFPVPEHVWISYGDIRGRESLQSYFSDSEIKSGAAVDAQTFAGLEAGSLDFVISAHVIEHLRDSVGSIVHAIRVLKPGGVFVLVVPDLRWTFDRNRPETTVEHALRDFQDGGEGTAHQGYEEHLRYVHPYLTGEDHPEHEIQRQATECVKRWPELDVHFHAWTRDGFQMLLAAVAEIAPFDIEAAESTGNENIFVLRKRAEIPRNFRAG